jgi:hypothetical protein
MSIAATSVDSRLATHPLEAFTSTKYFPAFINLKLVTGGGVIPEPE